MFKIKCVKVKDICKFSKNDSSLTKEKMQTIRGEYPVYTASVGVATGSINSYQNTIPSIIIPTAGNGSAGKPYLVKADKYSIGCNAIGLETKENVDIDYIFYKLRDCLKYGVKGESFKNINKTTIKNTEICIPIKEDGSFDLEKQKELANIYTNIEEQKNNLLNKIEFLKNIKIHFDDNSYKKKLLPLNNIISHKNGDSKYTKEYCRSHKGKYPVFSANNNIPLASLDDFDYDGEYLTYSKNGCAGYISIKKGKFSVNGDRCVIILNDDYKCINLKFLKYYLEPIFRANKKGRMGTNGMNEYTKLNSTMIEKLNIQIPIPIKSDGTFDLKKQEEIANKYFMIEEIKSNLIEKIKKLTNIAIA